MRFCFMKRCASFRARVQRAFFLSGARRRVWLGLALAASIILLCIVLFSGGGVLGGGGLSHSKIFANGISTARIRIPADALSLQFPDQAARDTVTARAKNGLVRVVSIDEAAGSGGLEITLAAGYQAGEETIEVRGLRTGTALYSLRLIAAPVDLDNDGIPDAAQLRSATDIYRFRSWFCSIAESQYYKIWDKWIPEQRDCAGLIRFAMREALMKHDDAWLARAGRFLLRASLPDVAAFQYPDIPFLGTDIFRVRPSSGGMGADGSFFSISDFSSFASARVLMDYNSVYLGHDLALLEEGDILFFEQHDREVADSDEVMHAMIYLGLRDNEEMLVYHTGDPRTGVVRKLSLRTLGQHPDARWHPHAANPYFLGVYRLSIIADAARRDIPPAPAPAREEHIRLRIFSLQTLSALSVEPAPQNAQGSVRAPEAVRVWDGRLPSGTLKYSADRVRLTAQGDRLFVDGDPACAPVHIYIQSEAVSPGALPPEGSQLAVPAISLSCGAPVRVSAGRASRVFDRAGAGPLEVYARDGELIVVASPYMEDYIPGVLAAEAAPWSSLSRAYARQYLMAQAVSCRSFAWYYAESRAGQNARDAAPGARSARTRHGVAHGEYFNCTFDVCDSTHCQVWRDPREPYPEIVLDAARATAGVVLGLRDPSGNITPAPGFYSSTAAASTVLPGEVWHGQELDIYFQPVTNRLPGGTEFLHARSPHLRWEWREKKEAFRDFLFDTFALRWDGALPKLEHSARGVVRNITFGLQGGAESIFGYVFRDAFCRARHWGSLRSLYFFVRFERGDIVFSGSGLGHGIGLCQYGALELARLGRTWKEILRFYYPKLVVTQSQDGDWYRQ